MSWQGNFRMPLPLRPPKDKGFTKGWRRTVCTSLCSVLLIRPNMASQLMSMQAWPLARAQLRHQGRPVSRPACIARHQLARVGAPGLAVLERGVHQARVGPSPRARRAVVTEAAKKSVGDLAKGDLEGKVVLVRAHSGRPLRGCRRLRQSMPGLWSDMLFMTYYWLLRLSQACCQALASKRSQTPFTTCVLVYGRLASPALQVEASCVWLHLCMRWVDTGK